LAVYPFWNRIRYSLVAPSQQLTEPLIMNCPCLDLLTPAMP
jgi:hypothetical protein